MLYQYPLKDVHVNVFKSLFKNYYEELGCDENVDHLLDEYVIADCIAGLVYIDVLDIDGKTAGFVIYQIDSPDNEWNEKQGMATVREIYLLPEYRKNGYGKFMLLSAEMKLNERGAEQSYVLPYDEAAAFFEKCGYKRTDEYNEDLDCNFYIKDNLRHVCSCHATEK